MKFVIMIMFLLPGPDHPTRMHILDVGSCDEGKQVVQHYRERGVQVLGSMCLRDFHMTGEMAEGEKP